ncbi:hypothetical protein HZ326_0733 [Fusarium oxysporum f. sp. albedinis]|nr:hypothetical protein HZ326_0733 [Fusarium oxysporum f. sp. albedinis]
MHQCGSVRNCLPWHAASVGIRPHQEVQDPASHSQVLFLTPLDPLQWGPSSTVARAGRPLSANRLPPSSFWFMLNDISTRNPIAIGKTNRVKSGNPKSPKKYRTFYVPRGPSSYQSLFAILKQPTKKENIFSLF